MLPLIKQKHLTDILYEAMLFSINRDFDTAECEFLYEIMDDGRHSLEITFHYELNGRTMGCLLSLEALEEVSVIVPELHALMKEFGMRAWYKCMMSCHKDGPVSLKFQYKKTGQGCVGKKYCTCQDV